PVELHADRREVDLSRGALEKACVECCLKLFDTPRQCRLRYVHFRRSGGEAAQFCHRHERFDVGKVEPHRLLYLKRLRLRGVNVIGWLLRWKNSRSPYGTTAIARL